MAAPAATMKAIAYDKYGDAKEVLHEAELPIPQPKEGQVQIKIHAAALNPVDWKFTKGYLAAFIPLKFPVVPALDLSGVVTAVGAGVEHIKIGDEVYADGGFDTTGSFAEYAVCGASAVAVKPKKLSWEDAAAIPLVFLTSYQALVDTAKLQNGHRVAILGGSGGCGIAAIQIAKNLGAWVATTSSSANHALVTKLGADKAIDYTKGDWAEELKDAQVDIVYDTIGAAGSWESAQKVLKKGGIYVSIAGADAQSTADHTFKKILVASQKGSQQLPVASEWIEQGKYHTIVAQTFNFSLANVLEMYEKSQSSRVVGKLVLKFA